VSLEVLNESVGFLGEKIGIVNPCRYIRLVPSADGMPYVKFDAEGYCFVYSERGVELGCEKTNDLDVLIFWVLDAGVSELAAKYELNNRVGGMDSRRVYFNKYIELFSRAGEKWKSMAEKKVKSILLKNPYQDDLR
jgi:hypothetical protein